MNRGNSQNIAEYSPISVCVRLKPRDGKEEVDPTFQIEGQTLTIFGRDNEGVAQEEKQFTFDYVFGENAEQNDVYKFIEPRATRAQQGFNFCIFAYGQTGAGKTYSIFGKLGSRKGIVPRAVEGMFSQIKKLTHKRFTIFVSFLELYLDNIRDLASNKQTQDNSLEIHEDESGTVFVKGLNVIQVTSAQEITKILHRGLERRKQSQNFHNENSSRSHCIFSISTVIQDRKGSTEAHQHFVDLAGSERLDKRETDDLKKKEAVMINSSLSVLGKCVMALGSGNRSHIPYRESKLTRILSNALGGNCYTTLLATVNTEAKNSDESLLTLLFAYRCANVRNRCSINYLMGDEPSVVYHKRIRELLEEIANLKEDNKNANVRNEKLHLRLQQATASKERKEFQVSTPRGSSVFDKRRTSKRQSEDIKIKEMNDKMLNFKSLCNIAMDKAEAAVKARKETSAKFYQDKQELEHQMLGIKAEKELLINNHKKELEDMKTSSIKSLRRHLKGILRTSNKDRSDMIRATLIKLKRALKAATTERKPARTYGRITRHDTTLSSTSTFDYHEDITSVPEPVLDTGPTSRIRSWESRTPVSESQGFTLTESMGLQQGFSEEWTQNAMRAVQRNAEKIRKEDFRKAHSSWEKEKTKQLKNQENKYEYWITRSKKRFELELIDKEHQTNELKRANKELSKGLETIQKVVRNLIEVIDNVGKGKYTTEKIAKAKRVLVPKLSEEREILKKSIKVLLNNSQLILQSHDDEDILP